ncbi:MAG TPA: pentapeptide repeat-containing protein [Steroidobacteraceae bacterium]|nr:pentapeptide repeat-containing protein [Steroidobacteraceae bacterium]
MANDELVAMLKQGVAAWNAWRDANPHVHPNLSETDLSGENLINANLSGANLNGAILREANLNGANLNGATLFQANLAGAKLIEAKLIQANLSGAMLRRTNLSGAILRGADFSMTDLTRADFTNADLRKAILSGAYLRAAILTNANLRGAYLQHATLVETILRGADLRECHIHGISAWNLELEGTKQQNLVITHQDEPEITIDDIEIAQFIYLLRRNEKIRNFIDTITSKAVLILGRFTAERKSVLDAIREELRRRDYLPILFDFDKPANRDVTETISLLARMARFVVADITDAKAIPQELNVIVPDLPSVPVQPLLLRESSEYGMFEHYARYPWVLPLYRYETRDQLIAALGEKVIEPAERKASELRSGAKPIPPII